MQPRHMHFADQFAGLEFGAHTELRAVGGIPGINPNTTIAGAPQVTTAQEGSVANTTPGQLDSNAGKATDGDAAVGAAILGNIRKKENDARNSHDLLTVIDGVGADGTLSTQEWASIQALGVQDGATELQMKAVRDAANQQAGIDSQNFQHSQETTDPDSAQQDFAELYKRIQGGNADQSQRAATELTRRYAAGVEWRGDIDIQIQLEARKLQTATTGDAKDQAQNAINRLKQQQAALDASLVNIRTAIKGSVEHGGALNGVRLNELRSKDNTIDSAAEASYAQQYGGKDGKGLPQGLAVTQDGKLAAVVPEGGSIWKTVEQFPTPDGKFNQALYDELVKNYGETVHPGQQLPLSKEATDRLRQSISLSPSDVSAAMSGGATVQIADQAKSDPNVLKNEGQLNTAVQALIDAPGDAVLDGTQFNDNNGGRATGHVRDLVTKFAKETGSTQAGIDRLVEKTQFDEDRGSNQVAKDEFKRDLYAAYGVQAAAPRSGGDRITQALTDFVDGADDQKFSADGAAGVSKVAKLDASQFTNIINDLKSKLGNNASLSRDTVAAYVNGHFFSHKENTGSKSAHEDSQRNQLTNALFAALQNGG